MTQRFPPCIDIELTNRCNMACKMCPRQMMTRPIGDMDFGTYEGIISQLPNTTEIRFIRYGEPLLYKRLFDAIVYARIRGFRTTIATNGLLIPQNMKALLLADSVRVSFQGKDKKGYESLRGQFYNKVSKNLIKLVAERGRRKTPEIIIGLSVDNEEDSKGFIKEWGERVDKIDVWRTSYTRVAHLYDFKGKKPEYEPCKEVISRLSIDWDGDIVACCSDYNKELKLGNIKYMTLEEAWKCDKMQDLRRILTVEMGHRRFRLCSTCLKMT